jgi:hypothetical protein
MMTQRQMALLIHLYSSSSGWRRGGKAQELTSRCQWSVAAEVQRMSLLVALSVTSLRRTIMSLWE